MLNIDYFDALTGIVVAVLAGLGAWITQRATARKTDVESAAMKVRTRAEATLTEATAEKTIGEAWASLYDTLRKRVDDFDRQVVELNARAESLEQQVELERSSRITLEERVSELENENQDLKAWAGKLVNQLKSAQIDPAPYVRAGKLNTL